ncbi:Transposable element Hobo transposase [Frankliniella fusca]|uniref:Transposable element Hobo transposase n=1 Tax=Frankliniella fusca TaxID=407009 RepID=A0AAE1LMN5_9NEOP|nr:Transposable element Hobo transposase [Frankliniella fusca]
METKYEVLSDVVRAALFDAPVVSLTADNWTDRGTNNSYLGVTVYYPHGDEIKTAVLGVTQLHESHTGDYLSTKLKEFCDHWGIGNAKVSMVITDNAEYIKLAVRKLFGDDRHLSCFDHTLNLTPKAAIGYKGDKQENGPNVPGVPPMIKDLYSRAPEGGRLGTQLRPGTDPVETRGNPVGTRLRSG